MRAIGPGAAVGHQVAAQLALGALDRDIDLTRRDSVTILKWWIRASIEVPMICLMWSRLLPMPSLPTDNWAGQAIFLSATMIGSPRLASSRSTACSTMRSDWYISSRRTRSRP